MGGHDPYSSSKACAELVCAAYRDSYFLEKEIGIASVRAGNVIGGGDWAENRLIPDMIAALTNNKPINIRNPKSVRPWQHVLEPLGGYLKLAERLYAMPQRYSTAFNFGPLSSDDYTVANIAKLVCCHWGQSLHWEETHTSSGKESQVLKLDSAKAGAELGWRPRLSIDEAIGLTVSWYKSQKDGVDMSVFSEQQIRNYLNG